MNIVLDDSNIEWETSDDYIQKMIVTHD